jgi:ubiquinone/menaquinone biosynthesis C-methylase UbiE
MRRLFYLLLGLTIIFLGVSLIWRWASRRRQLPCPSWLAWSLENPLSDIIGRTTITLDRIGLRPGEHGLDVGSGPGRLTLPAAERVGPTGMITAVDVQADMLLRLQQRMEQKGIKNIRLHHGDIAADHRLPPDSFDRAWLVTVLGEIPDRAAALHHIYQLLKPGGTLSITEMLGDPHYQRRSEVLRLAQDAGFEPAEYWQSGLAFTQNFVKNRHE